MMARELGGVVDPKLKVYGAANVRVVDASILPLQVSGHLTSTLYAVAERAAEMIIAGRTSALQKESDLVTSLLWNDESNWTDEMGSSV
jgi:choline dehydrogenase-like flavoprotein